MTELNYWQVHKQWHAIPKDDRDAIARNAYCTSCMGMTTVIEFNITMVGGDILLSGKCIGRVNTLSSRFFQ